MFQLLLLPPKIQSGCIQIPSLLTKIAKIQCSRNVPEVWKKLVWINAHMDHNALRLNDFVFSCIFYKQSKLSSSESVNS